ncbi:MAG: 50S ribosomal protein L3 [Planctomycetales bacterium]
MPVGLLGRKVGMTQVYDDAGNLLPVTVIEAGPCTVLQVRTRDRDGYEAVQLGFADKPRRLASRAERGHVTALAGKRRKQRESAGVELPPKADCEPKRFIREFRTDGEEHGLEVGQTLDAGLFADVTHIDVIGKTKGRGFTGVMKRHNFQGQPASHGAKRVHRHPGSIGQSADPSRVMKGMRMAGQYGNERVTIRHLRVVKVDPENNMLLVRGAVPGPNGQFVILRHTNKH